MDPHQGVPTLRRDFPATRSRRDLVTYPTDEKPEACRTQATMADKNLRVAPTYSEKAARGRAPSADLHACIAWLTSAKRCLVCEQRLQQFEPSGDDVALDVGRARIDGPRDAVSDDLLDAVLAHEPVTAEYAKRVERAGKQ